MKKILKNLILFPRAAVLVLVRIYQHTLSPDHGPLKKLFPFGYCRFQPTCSEYGHEAITKYGLVIGSVKILWRILRCNPFSKGGWDPVT